MPQKTRTMMEEHLNKMKVRLDNLLASVKEKLLDKERTIGVKPAELVYKDCPSPPPRSSVDLSYGRGPFINDLNQKPCRPETLAVAFPADDPMAFLLSSGSRKLSKEDQKQRLLMEASLLECKDFGDERGCERGIVDDSTLQPLCEWTRAKQQCTEKKNRTP